MRNYRVTGPVGVPDDVRMAMSGQMVSHRSAEFRERFAAVMARLRPVFGTSSPVLALTCSGTGGMEAAAGSVLREGDRVLSVQIGYFGERFAEVARHCGARVDVLACPWGQVVPPEDLAGRAAGYDAVLLTHNETSTGVLGPVREWAAAVRESSGALILVDVVSSLAATPVAFDELGIDVAVGVTQKALACPPGLALVAVSQRALTRARVPGSRAYYLDLARAADHAAEGTTSYTPAVPLVFALEVALDALESEGLPQVWARHVATADRCREVLRAHGLRIVPEAGLRSPTVTAVRLPGPWAPQVREALSSRDDIWVSSGRAAWKDDVLRIGHMGPVPVAQVEACARALARRTREAATTHGRGRRGGPQVVVRASAFELGEEWDELADACEAPVFQSTTFLRAYERSPVARILAHRYLEVYDGTRLIAAAPVFRQEDPLGLLGLAAGGSALVSAMWHCPDTRVVCRDDRALGHLVAAFAEQAKLLGCPTWGFINVNDNAAAVSLMDDQGLRRRELVPRWALDRSHAPDGETYLRSLRKPVRHELRRQLRRAREHGAQVVTHGPDHPALAELLRLVANTAARAGSPRYYDPQRLASLLRMIGAACRLIEVRGPDGAALAVGICFLEANRLQYWAAGYVRDDPSLSFSPYYVLWWGVLDLMWSSGVSRVECGRLNETFKRRMGLRPQPLVALLG